MIRLVAVSTASWVVAISVLHAWLNLGAFRTSAGTPRTLKVGYLPVTCHLTCPVSHFMRKGGAGFEPVRFGGFPELKEAFLSKHIDATFILAPMAMKLREDGVAIKIVYLGHRDGTALVVHKDSGITRVDHLRGRVVAVPNRYSNQRLLLFKLLRDRGMTLDDVRLREMAPPDMPAALYAKAVDAVSSGEPFMGATELGGYGRVLYLTKDVWPGFISCVLTVREDVIRSRRAQVQELVDGIARSGVWLDGHPDNRRQAAQFVGRDYYNQDPRLLEFVLRTPPDRVTYTNLTVRRADFEEIERLGRDAGMLQGTAGFAEYADPSFVREDARLDGSLPSGAVSPGAARQTQRIR